MDNELSVKYFSIETSFSNFIWKNGMLEYWVNIQLQKLQISQY